MSCYVMCRRLLETSWHGNGEYRDHIVRSIANSIVIIVFLSFMVAMILVRTVYRDIARYNRIPMAEKEDEV